LRQRPRRKPTTAEPRPAPRQHRKKQTELRRYNPDTHLRPRAGPDPNHLLAAGLAALDVAVDPDFQARVTTYLEELTRWNRLVRLTGYRDPSDQVLHLILESVMLLALEPDVRSPLVDLGSGAGAPGLILQFARPDWPVTLVEANRRRANFLRHVARKLGLGRTTVEEGRAEALASSPHLARAFQAVTVRAVAPAEVSVRLARPFVAVGGSVVVPLGPEGRAPGTIREVVLRDMPTGLRLRRRFLIIRADELPADVPRGTRGGRGPALGGSQPEGWGR
jgi:16S rRNA (guanine527-N7)-methyltransferase